MSGSSRGNSTAAALIASAFLTAAASGQTYVLREMQASGIPQHQIYGINVTGQAVGFVQVDDETRHAGYWINDEFTDLHDTTHLNMLHIFNVGYSQAFSISDGGQIVGTARKKIDCIPEDIIVTTAMLLRPAVQSDLGSPYPGDALTDLGTFGEPCTTFDSAAVGISNANHVVGWADINAAATIHAFLVTPVNGQWFIDNNNDDVNDLLVDLGTLHANAAESSATAVNNAGVVVGYSYTSGAAFHAFRIVPQGGVWNTDVNADFANDLMQDLGTLGGVNSWARGINNLGQIVGESDTADLNTRAFLWSNGVMTDLGTLGGANSSASRISDTGVIVGWAETASRERRAVAWINGQIIDLNRMLLPNSNPSIVLQEARDINESGEIAGWGRITGASGKFRSFLLRLATAQEIQAAEAEVVAGTSTDNEGGDDSEDSTGGVVVSSNGGVGGANNNGVPINGTPNTLTDGASNGGSNAGGDGAEMTPTAPALCGFGAGFAPLMLAGIGGLRRVRRTR